MEQPEAGTNDFPVFACVIFLCFILNFCRSFSCALVTAFVAQKCGAVLSQRDKWRIAPTSEGCAET